MHERCVVDVPDEIWEQIISLLDHDRYLESLSTVSKRFLAITNQFKQTLKITVTTPHFLPKLFHRFPNLKNISFCEYHGCPDEIIRQIANTHFALESLDLSGLENFPSEAIQEIPKSCLGSIKSLKLANLCALNDVDLEVIAGLMCNLEELDISEPRDEYKVDEDVVMNGGGVGITDDGVDLLATKLGKLRRVNLSGNSFVSDQSVLRLVEKCVNLEEIVVKNCSFVTQIGVDFALRECRNLRSVALEGMDLVAPEIGGSFACAHNLSVLEFSFMNVSDQLLGYIVKASIPLKKLTIDQCKNFTWGGIVFLLRKYQAIEYFSLEGVYWITDQNIVDVSKGLRKATTVKLGFCSKLTTSAMLTLLKNCPSLERLEMEKTDLGKLEFAVSNVNHPRIRELLLSGNKTLSNECLENIALSCPNIELLDVSDCPAITRKGIGEIVRTCTNLRHLNIHGCATIKSLGIDKKLQRLEVLQASSSGLNDEGLFSIAKKCPALMKLDLMSCSGVTPKGVQEVVKQCVRLRAINLSYCRDIGRDTVYWVMFTRPSLRKIVLPHGWIPSEEDTLLFLRHGCQVIQPEFF